MGIGIHELWRRKVVFSDMPWKTDDTPSLLHSYAGLFLERNIYVFTFPFVTNKIKRKRH
jgi:hypothetical protein